MPLVTIMIPTYNQDGYIKEAILSALNQTYTNIEILIGDDASTDMTQRIVESINDQRIKYIRNESNIGRAENYRNLLYNNASGDYVVNLDGDDFYTDPDFILEAVRMIRDNPSVVMVVAKVETREGNKRKISSIPEVESLKGINVLQKLPNIKYFPMHMSTVYKREDALKLDFYRSSAISSDWESLFRLALHGNVCYLDRTVGVWRIHSSNETGSRNYQKHLDNLKVWPVVFDAARLSGMNMLIAKTKATMCIAYFAQSSLPAISKSGNLALVKFLIIWFITYPASFIVFLFSGRGLARLALSFFGYYQK